MSRVSTIEKLYRKPKKNALEFDYETLWAPPIYSLFTYQDIQELYKIATSVKLSGNINKKYQLIDTVMKRRGFRFDHRGTNRATYRFLEDSTFLAKVALDRVGIKDSPAEYKNQNYFKPFCCKIFEVDPTGVIAFVERVNPITSLEEFASVSEDIFNMMVTKVIGKYVVDDLGTTKYMNYGIRMRNGCAFGPVIIDFPYAYELDGAKLVCNNIRPGTNIVCGGEIDYDAGFNHLICKRCGREYSAKELKKDESLVLKMYGDSDRRYAMRARVINSDGKVLMDSGRSSNTHVSKEDMELASMVQHNESETVVAKTTVLKSNKKERPIDINRRFYEEQMAEYRRKVEEAEMGPFNPVIKKPENVTRVTKTYRGIIKESNPVVEEEPKPMMESTVVETTHINEDAIKEAIPELINAIGENIKDYKFDDSPKGSGVAEVKVTVEPAIAVTIETKVDEEDSDFADVIIDTIKEAAAEETHFNAYEEEDYSDYEPEDYNEDDPDEDEDDKYAGYIERFEKEDRKNYKKNKRRQDMSDY